MEEPDQLSAALSQTMKAWAHFISESQKDEDPFKGTAVDVAGALRSVASAETWALGGALFPVDRLISALGLGKESAESPTVIQARTTDGFLPIERRLKRSFLNQSPADPDELNFAPFKSKYLHVFPLYQDYCQRAVQDPPWEGVEPEPLTSQCRPVLRGLRFKAKLPVTVASPPPARLHRGNLTTFWQDLDEVRERGILATLGRREIHRQEAMFEVMGSETSYLRSLGVAVHHFLASETLSRTLSPLEHHVLFSNLRHVMSASESFLVALECLLGECVVMPQLGDLVLQHCPRFQALYVPYVSNMMFQEALINKLLQENKGFVSALKTLESDPKCQRQSLKSFLVLPFQRITRLKLLMENVLRLTEPDADSYLNQNNATEALHKVLVECNQGVRRMKQIEELVCLERLLDFSNVKLLPLIVKGRFLLHEGPLRQLAQVSSDSKISFSDVHLHLFSDLLLISVQKPHPLGDKEQSLAVLEHASFPGSVSVEPLNASALGLPADSFLLRLSQNHAGRATALILAARSRCDKVAWMKVLSAES